MNTVSSRLSKLPQEFLAKIKWPTDAPTVGTYYNGLLQTQHVVAVIKQSEIPLKRDQIWEKLKDTSGIKSKTHLKRLLKWLRKRKQIKSLPDPLGGDKFCYKALEHKKNNFEIPTKMEKNPVGVYKVTERWVLWLWNKEEKKRLINAWKTRKTE